MEPGRANLFLREEELRRGLELLFFANRDLNRDTITELDQAGLGRAHHRVLYFVSRNPGITVTGLLKILQITKQSLSRVLTTLMAEDYIRQEEGIRDRRQRKLFLTEKGATFEDTLFRVQRDRIADAYRASGPEAVAGFWDVLLRMVNPEDRATIISRMERENRR